MARPLILITNDDGVSSPGLSVLASAMDAMGEVWVYAPDREQSAVSHGISIHRPLRVQEVGERRYMVDGTPTDCVMLAVHELLEGRPDLVISGINNGANLGDDLTYSGTVAGAHEGMLLGIPSIAMSNVSYQPEHLDTAGRVAAKLAAHVLEEGLPDDTLLNVNVPDVPYDALEGVAITRMGQGTYDVEIVTRKDPRGVTYYWIGGTSPQDVARPGTDFEAVAQGRVSITPIHRDVTNEASIGVLEKRAIEL